MKPESETTLTPLCVADIARQIERSAPAVDKAIKRLRIHPEITTGRSKLYSQAHVTMIREHMRQPNISAL